MPFFGQTIFNIVHWTANIFAICVLFPEMDCERNLGKFGTHAEKSRAPHPENCAGTAEGNRARNACDVAGADRACKRGTDCLERAMEPSFACVLSKILPIVFFMAAPNLRT